MSNCPRNIKQDQRRLKSLNQLSHIYSEIEYLQIAEKDFSTEDLQKLGLFADYSINSVYSQEKLYGFHTKLSDYYWEQLLNKNNQKLSEALSNRQLTVHTQLNLQTNSTKIAQNDKLLNSIKEVVQFIRVQEIPEQPKITETLQEQIVCIQQKVSKNYNQIRQFILQLNSKKIDSKDSTNYKIQILNAWTSIPSKLQCFTPKKNVLDTKKNVQFSELQIIKKSKITRKDSTHSESSRTIILGKNESTQTKKMKHMLKVQAKTNFVQQKKKEQDQLNDLDKKTIQLNYLLNVITKQFFQDFSNDILLVVKDNCAVIPILCEKIIQKIKEQHNFIQIYVNLIKKMCKQQFQQRQIKNSLEIKFNLIQKNFVEILQASFTQLISQKTQASCSNFNQYKYQKQIIGMCTFIGKLIRQKILSKNIFKVCFWEIIYRYVQKVKQNPENEIVNQCLVNGIVLISDFMGPVELLKLTQKQRERKYRGNLMPLQQNKLQKMVMALVNPNDQDNINRQEQSKHLIQTVRVQDYPRILIGITHVFISKRMKLQFLIQSWQQKLSKIKLSSISQIEQSKQEQTIQKGQIEEDLIFIKRHISDYIKEMKVDQNINQGLNKSKENADFIRHQKQIHKFMKFQDAQTTNKVFKLLVVEFLNQFSDTYHHNLIEVRIQYFMQFINSFNFRQPERQLLEIICLDQLQNLMMIECDYPFLIKGLCQILIKLMKKLSIPKDDILNQISNGFDSEDQDMIQFFEKVRDNLNKLCREQFLQD